MGSVSSLIGCQVVGRDGEVGSVRDVYFDDQRWAIRYAIAHTGSWLFGRQVLISPVLVCELRLADGEIYVNLNRAQIQASPHVDTQKPVSRQMEAAYGAYYRYPPYWAYGYSAPLWGWGPLPCPPFEQSGWERAIARELHEHQAHPEPLTDAHLRSANEIIGYSIEAQDGSIGHVEDLLFDEESWGLRNIVVDTRNWWPGKQVVIPADRLANVSWPERSVRVTLTRDQITASPEFDSDTLPERSSVRPIFDNTDRGPSHEHR